MSEIWKDIPGFEGFYQASDTGLVRSLKRATTKGKVLAPTLDTDGYERVTLSKNGRFKSIGVHRAVALAFLDNNLGYPMVNHKDENKRNNRADNLEWCSAKYNTNYNNMPMRRAKAKRRPINQYTKDGVFVRCWSSRAEIVEAMHYAGGNVTSCCLGHRKTAHGYVWEYAEVKNERT